MIQRRLIGGALLAVAAGVACIDLSSPKGAAAISLLQVPYPSIVVGDVMRDSLGNPAPLRLVAYDGAGDTLTSALASFFLADSASPAHLQGGDTLFGDRFGIAHAFGQISNLQTPAVPIFVTVAPTQIVAQTNPDTLRAPFGTDSTTRGQSSAIVLMTGQSDSAAQGYILHWSLSYAPPSVSGRQAVFLGDASARATNVDTTNVSGQATMFIYVVTPYLNDPALAKAGGVDSAVFTATAMYRGTAVPGSPVRFVVPITLGAIH